MNDKTAKLIRKYSGRTGEDKNELRRRWNALTHEEKRKLRQKMIQAVNKEAATPAV
jgi:hypothetical protein